MARNVGNPGEIKKLDEVVVNRIAAGEVIQRPANALKEMLENCLDAGSSQITVTVKGGGLKMLQIQDNGTGIRKEDLMIVAERFTTSKLREFGDLTSIATHGFRGEALASISHVAHLSILTKTRGSPCGYKCQYSDGLPVAPPQPLAANQGTCITVEDLFYNVPTRRDALRSPSEEFNKISEVISRYAIHNSGVGMALKKAGETGVEVKTVSSNSVIDNIRTIYGPAVAKELIEFSMEDTKFKFTAKGQVSNVNYNVKKFVFLLFINNRLVESTALKRAIENVYQSYLPKGSSPFVYLSLNIAPENVDVNVHPTKHEVFFLHQETIVEKIQQALEEKLLNSNASRTFYTQKLLPGAGAVLEMFETKEKKEYAKDMVRTDSNLQKLDRFLTKEGININLPERSSLGDLKENEVLSMKGKGEKKGPLGGSNNVKEASEEIEQSSEELEFSNEASKLDSVCKLRADIASAGSPECRAILAGHTFVGCVDRRLALIQHSTKLYLANSVTLSKHLFRQLILRDIGQFDVLKLCPPPPVKELALLALEQEESGWSEANGSKEELADKAEELLASKAELLKEYFSLELSRDPLTSQLVLAGVPALLEGYCPWWQGLPVYLLRVAAETDWGDEESCIDSLTTETAHFYAVRDAEGARFDPGQHSGLMTDWRETIEQVLYPAIKSILLPPRSCLTDRSLLQVANLPDLYKVFERC